jgi:signal transduction histidine kinase
MAMSSLCIENYLKIALDSSQAGNVYKSQIMAMVSHEMKTPLHAVVAGLQLLY